MPTYTFDVEDRIKLIDSAIQGFDQNRSPKKPTAQIAMETAIRLLRRDGEINLALGLVLLHVGRMQGTLSSYVKALLQHDLDVRYPDGPDEKGGDPS